MYQNKASVQASLKDLKEHENQRKRQDTAQRLISGTKKAPVWLQVDNIRYLYFYLDFEFVRNELISIYRTSQDLNVKKTIKALYEGTLDVTDLIERQEELQEITEEIEKAREEYYQKLDDDYFQDLDSQINGKLVSKEAHEAVSSLKLKYTSFSKN